jgi:Cft2 family RNA processing exonuclease
MAHVTCNTVTAHTLWLTHTLILMATPQVCEGVEVTAYPAGHVLGAVMLHVRVGSESILYTGESIPPQRVCVFVCVSE